MTEELKFEGQYMTIEEEQARAELIKKISTQVLEMSLRELVKLDHTINSGESNA